MHDFRKTVKPLMSTRKNRGNTVEVELLLHKIGTVSDQVHLGFSPMTRFGLQLSLILFNSAELGASWLPVVVH